MSMGTGKPVTGCYLGQNIWGQGFEVIGPLPVPHSETPQAEGQPWTSHKDIGMPPASPPSSPPSSPPAEHALPAQTGGFPCPDTMLEDSEMLPDMQTLGLSAARPPLPVFLLDSLTFHLCHECAGFIPTQGLCAGCASTLLGCCPSALCMAPPSYFLGFYQVSPPQEPLLTAPHLPPFWPFLARCPVFSLGYHWPPVEMTLGIHFLGVILRSLPT